MLSTFKFFSIYILLLLNLFLCSNFLHSQTFRVEGNISTFQPRPVGVKNAKVSLINKNDSLQIFSALTDSIGNYKLNITIVSADDNKPDIPTEFELAQNYPNPFSTETAIIYKLNEAADATITIYDILGQEIKKFTAGVQGSGVYGITWEGTDNFNRKVAPGVYFYQLQAGKKTIVKKMVLGSSKNQVVTPNGFSALKKPFIKVENKQFAEPVFDLEINNVAATEPQIYDSAITNIKITGDTVLNFMVSKIETSQTFNVQGMVSAASLPVKYAEITFININDTIQNFSAITDTLGYYHLSISAIADISIFKVIINKISATDPHIYKLNVDGISFKSDTVINFIVDKVESRTFIVQGNVATVSLPVKYAEVTFINSADTTKKFTAATDSLGNYMLSISKYIDELYFRAEIKNTNTAQPQIYSQVLNNIALQRDTKIDFTVHKFNDKVFSIYFLKDSTIKIDQIMNTDLSTLELSSTPWLTNDDIEFYDWSSHFIYLKKDKSFFFPRTESPFGFPQSWLRRPWVVVANKIPVYAGCFFSIIYSNNPLVPFISDMELYHYPADVLTFEGPFSGRPDPRGNAAVKSALIENNIYHAGISAYIDTTDSPVKYVNGLFEYTIHIKNNDQDPLYIFDPGKVDAKYFFFYNNGPTLTREGSLTFYSPNPNTEIPAVWDSTWYSLLKSGESIERTIKLSNYPAIPPGRYYLYTVYGAPNVDRDIRKNTQGRYWIGDIGLDKITVTISY